MSFIRTALHCPRECPLEMLNMSPADPEGMRAERYFWEWRRPKLCLRDMLLTLSP
jgi:hypothetical protein